MLTRRAVIGSCLAPSFALAALNPSRIITMVVPFTAGGSADILARLLMQNVTLNSKITHVIENKGGAGGTIAASQVAKAAADGHTLFMGHLGTMAVNPHIYATLDYNSMTSFTPISMVARVHNVLAVHPKRGFKTLSDLIAFAKANPNKLNYGTGGVGSAAHIATAALMLEAGIEMTHVPYRGTAPAMNDLLGGQIDLILSGAPVLLPHVKASSITALAVSGLNRLAFAPDIPTLAEGLNRPNFEVSQWYGVLAPANLPQDILQYLNIEISRAMNAPEVRLKLEEEGAEVWVNSPADFKAFIAAEFSRWKQVVEKAGIKGN